MLLHCWIPRLWSLFATMGDEAVRQLSNVIRSFHQTLQQLSPSQPDSNAPAFDVKAAVDFVVAHKDTV